MATIPTTADAEAVPRTCSVAPRTAGRGAGPRPLGLTWPVTLAAVAVGLLWAYAPTFRTLPRRWQHDPQYSHGYVVPLFALAVLWFRRDRFPAGTLRASWGGLALVAAGCALHLAGAWFHVDWFDGLSLLPVLLGSVVLAGGWRLGRWAAPAIALLVFMVPLPASAESALAGPLRGLATAASTYALQTLGLPAVAEGNVIYIDDVQVGVHEACSGLGMLFAFFALSSAVALVIRRPLLDRIVVFLSAVPVGVLMNLVRITAAGFVFRYAGGDTAKTFFHDASGWLMMPLALLVLWLELKFLARLFTDPPPDGPVPLASTPVPSAAHPTPPGRTR